MDTYTCRDRGAAEHPAKTTCDVAGLSLSGLLYVLDRCHGHILKSGRERDGGRARDRARQNRESRRQERVNLAEPNGSSVESTHPLLPSCSRLAEVSGKQLGQSSSMPIQPLTWVCVCVCVCVCVFAQVPLGVLTLAHVLAAARWRAQGQESCSEIFWICTAPRGKAVLQPSGHSLQSGIFGTRSLAQSLEEHRILSSHRC